MSRAVGVCGLGAEREAEYLLRKANWLDVEVVRVSNEGDCSVALFVDRKGGEEVCCRAYIAPGARGGGELVGVEEGWDL